MLKRVDVATYNSFMDAKNGTWKAGVEVLGLKDGGVGYAVDENNEKILTPEAKAAADQAEKPTSSRARSRCTTTCPTTSARRKGVSRSPELRARAGLHPMMRRLGRVQRAARDDRRRALPPSN